MRPLAAVVGCTLVACAVEEAAPAPEPLGCDEIRVSSCVYAQPPNVAACEAGLLTTAWTQRALAEVNRVRALAGLPPVAYDHALEAETAACALITAANDVISEAPDSASACWTAEGADACGRLNLTAFSFAYQGTQLEQASRALLTPEEVVHSWMVDRTDEATLGHRRWILDPFWDETAFAMVHRARVAGDRVEVRQVAGLQIADPTPTTPGDLPRDFVAWPIGEVSSLAFDRLYYLSFSALPDPTSYAGNADVDFTAAVVTVTGPGGPMTVVDQRFDNRPIGIPNNLQWLVDALEVGVPYAVRIGNVRVNGAARTYEYTFTIEG